MVQIGIRIKDDVWAVRPIEKRKQPLYKQYSKFEIKDFPNLNHL
jgi:hypothetical protein